MLRHAVPFRFQLDLGMRELGVVLDGLARLPALFPVMRRFGPGEDISRRDRTFTQALAVEFERRRNLDGTFRPAIEDRVIARLE